jgi:hypothetical protein
MTAHVFLDVTENLKLKQLKVLPGNEGAGHKS